MASEKDIVVSPKEQQDISDSDIMGPHLLHGFGTAW
jgi:hypothetical protein